MSMLGWFGRESLDAVHKFQLPYCMIQFVDYNHGQSTLDILKIPSLCDLHNTHHYAEMR